MSVCPCPACRKEAFMEMMTPITEDDLIRMAGKITFPPEAIGCGVGGCVEAPHDVDVMHSWDDPE